MTTFGKILAFLNLIAGLGFVSYGATIYFQRPGWFNPAPQLVDKGQSPQTFAQLKQEIDDYGRSATVASVAWGKGLNRLKALEQRRADRVAEWKKRSAWIRTGNPNPPDAKDQAPGFFKPVYEMDAGGKATALLDHTKLGESIKLGGVALRGADTLKADYDRDVAAVDELEKLIEADLKEYERLGVDIRTEDLRKLKMGDIRAAVQSELFYLSTFEVNVYETRETVMRRKKQLTQSLMELGGK